MRLQVSPLTVPADTLDPRVAGVEVQSARPEVKRAVDPAIDNHVAGETFGQTQQRVTIAALPAYATYQARTSSSASDSGRVLEPPWGHSRCLSRNGLAAGFHSISLISLSATTTRSTTIRHSSSRRAGNATYWLAKLIEVAQRGCSYRPTCRLRCYR